MTHMLRTISFKRRIFALLILCIITSSIQVKAQNLDAKVFYGLAEGYFEEGQYYLSYLNAMNAFNLLETEGSKYAAGYSKYNAGYLALQACFKAGQHEDAARVIEALGVHFPDSINSHRLLYAYNLSLMNSFTKSAAYMQRIDNDDDLFQRQVLQSYNALNMNQVSRSIEYIDALGTDNEGLIAEHEYDVILQDIRAQLADVDNFKKKHQLISVPMSMIIPGAGQMYSGYFYDGMNSLIINGLTGYACYASWAYALDKDAADRSYTMPVISSALFLFTYISNIYNTINLTSKANLYSKNQKVKSISESFRLIIQDESFLIGASLDF